MRQLDPVSPEELAIALKRAVKQSGLSLAQVCRRLEAIYGVKLTVSGLSHVINRGTIRLQRAIQILAIWGVEKVGVRQSISPKQHPHAPRQRKTRLSGFLTS